MAERGEGGGEGREGGGGRMREGRGDKFLDEDEGETRRGGGSGG